jgi:hypothetical protein
LLCGACAVRCGAWSCTCTSTVAAVLSLRCIRTCTAPALGQFLPLGLLLGETTRTPSKPRHPSSSGAPASDHSSACKRVVLLLLLYGTVRVQAVRSPPRRGTVQRPCTATRLSLFAQYTCVFRRHSQAPLPLIMVPLTLITPNHTRPTNLSARAACSALTGTLFPFCAVLCCTTRSPSFLSSQQD